MPQTCFSQPRHHFIVQGMESVWASCGSADWAVSSFSLVSCGRTGREIEEREITGLLGRMSITLETTILVLDSRPRINAVSVGVERKMLAHTDEDTHELSILFVLGLSRRWSFMNTMK